MRWDEITEDAPVPRPRAELSRVTLAHSVDSDDGVIPAGSTGTIVHVYPGAPAYEIEFTAPIHTVATVKADDIITA
jgi:hypothetical protein